MKYTKITDEELVAAIDRKVKTSVGSYTNSSDLSKRRENSTYEFAMSPEGPLKPQGVSTIVSSDTVDVVESYTALLVKLLLDNNKIAQFTPINATPSAIHNARMASDVVNYCIFNQQAGWEILNTWIKSALLYGNGILTWGWMEDFDYEIEEYEEIAEVVLDQVLADPMVEIVGDLEVAFSDITEVATATDVKYKNVRLRRKVDKSGVKIEAVPPESFLLGKGDKSIQGAQFVGKVTDMTYSDIRKNWPDFKGNLKDLTDEDAKAAWSLEEFARKDISGTDNFNTSKDVEEEDEANTSITVIECWIRSDRDGDGIAELVHVIKAGMEILEEEDVSYIPMASLNPVEIVHEFYGLSLADRVRPQMQATTAIMRGFVENVYFGNYGIKYADPNVVDFAALQNPKPKQVVATNGNPAAAVVEATPSPISPGTSGMLDFLSLQKEQSTGLTKTAMGLNDTLYVSGNSEAKMAGAQSAAQLRIEHIGRRFAETGLKDLCRGILKEMKMNLKTSMVYQKGKDYASFSKEDLMMMPSNMDLNIQTNLGENSNQNVQAKLQGIGELLGTMAQDETARKFINPMAALSLGVELIDSMGKDPMDYLLDPMDEQVQEQIKSQDEETGKLEKLKQEYDIQMKEAELDQVEANIELIDEEVENKRVDNIRQIYQAQTDADVRWAEVAIKAQKEGVPIPARPELPPLSEVVRRKEEEVKEIAEAAEQPEQPQQQQEIPPELLQLAQTDPQQAMQVAQQMGIDLSQFGL